MGKSCYDAFKHFTEDEKIAAKNRIPITQWCHEILRLYLPRQGIYVDATMGNGHDTLFLCQLAKNQGHVYAFDIQQTALEHTEQLLRAHGINDGFSLILDSHVHMGNHLEPETADAIVFNCGYLPGGDHSLATRPETTVAAIEAGLSLLKTGGVMSLCLYSGGDTGFAEKETVLKHLKNLDSQRYTVIVQEYYNRQNHPPTPVFLFKNN